MEQASRSNVDGQGYWRGYADGYRDACRPKVDRGEAYDGLNAEDLRLARALTAVLRDPTQSSELVAEIKATIRRFAEVPYTREAIADIDDTGDDPSDY